MSAPKRPRRAPRTHRPKGATRDDLERLADETDDERTALLLGELLDRDRDEPHQSAPHRGATHEAD